MQAIQAIQARTETARRPRTAQRGLPMDDQIDLVWYFGRGACRFARSTFGAMTDRMVMFDFGSAKCPACTDGIRWDFECKSEMWTDGDGHQQRNVWWIDRESGKRYETNECPVCKGVGAEPVRRQKRRPGPPAEVWI